jgi:hypothetical protein
MNDIAISQKRSLGVEVCRWAARMLSLGLIAVFLIFWIAEGELGLVFRSSMMQCLVVAVVGLGLGWKWEAVGGGLSLAGVAGFYALNFAQTGRFPGGWVFPLMFVPGILYLIAAGWDIKTKNKNQMNDKELSANPPK